MKKSLFLKNFLTRAFGILLTAALLISSCFAFPISVLAGESEYSVSVGATVNGTITSSSSTIAPGGSVTLNVTPASGYRLLELNANGIPVPCKNGVYTFEASGRYINSSAAINITATFCENDVFPAVYIPRACTWSARWFTQVVYLEPETEYVFSYKYSNLPASWYSLTYTTVDASGKETRTNSYTSSTSSNDTEYNMQIISFTTVALDSVENLSVSDGLIKSNIGFLINKNIGDAYLGGKCLYGDLILYKKNDPYKTNLFTDLEYKGIAFNNKGNWRCIYENSQISNFYSQYDADSSVAGRQHPKMALFKKKLNVEIAAGENGTVTTASSAIVPGQQVVLDVTPASGYRLLELNANGVPVPCKDGVYTFEASGKYIGASSSINVTATFCKEGTLPAVYIPRACTWSDRWFTQVVYLEPETEYVFSYKYSNLPANGIFASYTTLNASGSEVRSNSYNTSSVEVESEYKMNTAEFTTVALGTKENMVTSNGLIKSNVGIRINKNIGEAYLGGKCLYGDLILYKKNDPYKTNLFTDLEYKGISFNNKGNWRCIYETSQISNFYSQYDADSSVAGRQHPSSDVFTIYNRYISADSTINTNGTVTVASNGIAGQTVSVSAVPDDGYWTRGVAISADGSTVTKVNSTTFSFVMPNQNVKVYANFKAIFPGDINDDDMINLLDLVRMKKHFANMVEDAVIANADLDSNGGVDASDLAKLRKSVLSGVIANKELDTTETLNNTHYNLNKRKELTVAYFGGSITVGTGSSDASQFSYRARTTEWLRKNYPNAAITETNAAIGGTGTELGMHRAIEDLRLAENAPDLLFIEFAINDVYDSTSLDRAKSNLETIINTVYDYSPTTDIVLLFTTDLSKLGTEFNLVKAQKEIAAGYNLPYIDLGARLAEVIIPENGGTAPTSVSDAVWAKYVSDIVHPTDLGHKLYSDCITAYLDKVLAKAAAPSALTDSFRPNAPICEITVNPTASNFKGQTAPEGFYIGNDGFLGSDATSGSFTFTFKGTDINLWARRHAGTTLTFVIDDGAPISITINQGVSAYFNSNVANGLENTEHTVRLSFSGPGMGIHRFLISGAKDSYGVNIVQ